MKWRVVLIGLVICAVVAAVVAWWLLTFHQVPREIDLPARGEARYNPLFALKKILKAQDIAVESRGDLNLAAMALKPGDLLVLATDVRSVSVVQAESLTTWVENGGHLVFGLPQGDEGRAGELVDYFGLSVSKHAACLTWKVEPASEASSHCSRFRFQVDPDSVADFDWLWGSSENGYVYGRQRWSEGSWLVAADLDFLDNRHLDDAGMAAFAFQALAPMLGKGKAHLVYAADVPPLYVLIIQRGWPVLLPLLLALLAWLWARSERFGPLLPALATHRRALLAHVHAAGEFAFARGRGPVLYLALRRSLFARLRRREPGLAALAGDALVHALADKYQIAAADIHRALHPVDLSRPDQFLATIKTLMQLRAKS